MSFQTAPVGLVMTAIVVGSRRERPLAGRLEQALGREPRLQLLEAEREVPHPGGLDRLDVELERALRLEQVDPAVGHDPQTRPAPRRPSGAGRRGTRRTGAGCARP